MIGATRYTAGILSILLFGCSAWAQVLNPSRFIVLPPEQNPLGVYFATSQPTASQSLAGADVFLRNSSGIHRLTTVVKKSDSVTDFAVSEDGKLLAFTTSRQRGVSILHTESGRIEPIPVPSACLYGECPLARLHFTSDAKYLLFNVTSAPSNESPSWVWPLYAVRLANGHAEMLAAGELNESSQRVVSDEGKIVFASADPAATIALPQPPVNVYTVQLDKTGLNQLTTYGTHTENVASHVSIDRSGSLITFQVKNSTYPQAHSSVFRANNDGTEIESLSARSQSCLSPTLSSKGAQIAYVCDGGKLYLAEGNGPADSKALTSFPYSRLDHLVLDEKTNELLFTSGPPGSSRFGETGAIFGIELETKKLDKIQFQRHLNVVNNRDTGGAFTPVAGGIITVEASNLRSNSFFQANHTPLPDLLAGAALYVNGERAPIFSVSPWEMKAQLPWRIPAEKASFQLKFSNGDKTQVLEEQVAPNSPWVEGRSANNNFGCQADVYHAGTTLLADQAHPARIGETVDIIASGLGPTTHFAPDGVPTPTSPSYPISGRLDVYLNSALSKVKFAGLQPGVIGKYRVSVVVPPVTSNWVQITLQINDSGLTGNSCVFFAKAR